MGRTYWLDLFTGKTWGEFLEAGGRVSGFRESRWKTVRQIKTGDYLMCYLTGISRWVGVLEVAGSPYRDTSPIWKDEVFPCRVPVRVVSALTPETGVPVLDLRGQLSIFNDDRPNAWIGWVRASPAKWSQANGEIIINAIFNAEKNPVIRSVDKTKLGRRPTGLEHKGRTVTVPEEPAIGNGETKTEVKAHTEVQWLLLKLGQDMGYDVWVASNDRGRGTSDHKFSELARLKSELPSQFDEATNRTIEHIDVLWFKGNTYVAAFEIESTTSSYSGLLRMSDLIAMQPNLKIPLYIVAPDERRDKVIEEVNRPTFSRLSPPMSEMCRFVSFGSLRDRLSAIGSVVGLRYLKPQFLEELSESCEIEEV